MPKQLYKKGSKEIVMDQDVNLYKKGCQANEAK